MNDSKALVLIPSRYGSSRFPGKPLAPILNKPMIQWVYENCAKSGFDVWVVTDHDEIETCVKGFGGNVCRVDDDVSSGTERIQLAYERNFSKENYDYVINVQGDEPLLKGEELNQLVCKQNLLKTPVATIVKKYNGFDEHFKDPDKVKVAMSPEGICHYFSRAPIPFERDQDVPLEKQNWFHHIGVYSYTPEALNSFAKHPATELELAEKLEQLRALDMGLQIGALVSEEKHLGVDKPEDIEKIAKEIEGELHG